MEIQAAVALFWHSELKRHVRYVKMLGDGDSKVYMSVKDSKPYGDVDEEKLECVRHVEKRMGTRFRNLIVKLGGTKLSDGKFIKGPGN